MPRSRFRVNPHPRVISMSRNSLPQAGTKSEGQVTATGPQPRTTYFLNEQSNDWGVLWVLSCRVHLTVCFCHVTYPFRGESTLYSFLNLNELLARSWREIGRWSDCNWTRTQNHLVLKGTLNHLVGLPKWLSCVLSTLLYGGFDCLFLSCHIPVSEWIHTLYLLECQGTSCSKQVRNLKFKWL